MYFSLPIDRTVWSELSSMSAISKQEAIMVKMLGLWKRGAFAALIE